MASAARKDLERREALARASNFDFVREFRRMERVEEDIVFTCIHYKTPIRRKSLAPGLRYHR